MQFKSLLAYFLIAVSVYALTHPSGCKGKDQSTGSEVVYVPRVDTIIRYISGETVIRTISRLDTVHDRVMVDAFQPVDTPVLILFADRDQTDGVRLFEGTGKGEDGRCDYKYLLGIHEDSLQFLIVETDCKREIKTITIENPLGAAPVPGDGLNGWMVGGKMGMTFDKSHKTYGVQAAYRGLYASLDYVPSLRKPILEAGVLFPISRKNRNYTPVSDTITIKYQ